MSPQHKNGTLILPTFFLQGSFVTVTYVHDPMIYARDLRLFTTTSIK